MTNNRKLYIKLSSLMFFKEFNIDIPFNYKKIAKKLGFKIFKIKKNEIGLSATPRVISKKNCIKIFLNTENTIEKINFDFAILLGHLYLNLNKEDNIENSLYFDSLGGSELEEAIYFGINLLLPEHLFLKLITDGLNNKIISEKFKVDETLVIKRRSELLNGNKKNQRS